MELDWLLPVRRKGDAWREGRKLVDRSLRPGAISSYRWMIEEKTHWFLGQLLTTPRQFRDHIQMLESNLFESYASDC
jgi:cytochrome P450